MTGPYKVNGVPLRRVNQAYTMTSSTTVDIKGADVSKIEDVFFKKEKKSGKSQDEKFFAEGQKVTFISLKSSIRKKKCKRRG